MASSKTKLLQIIEAAAAEAAAAAATVDSNPPTPTTPTAKPRQGTAVEGVAAPTAPPKGGQRTVMELRPRPGLFVDSRLSVADAARKMASANTDAALVVSASGQLEGIMTDTDVARKVLARQLSPAKMTVASVMTTTPQVVAETDTAFNALSVMVGGRFRHLPVLDAAGTSVIGVLDVAKCLFAAISRIEASQLPGGEDSLAELLASGASTHVAMTPSATPLHSPVKGAATPAPLSLPPPVDDASLVVAIRPSTSVLLPR